MRTSNSQGRKSFPKARWVAGLAMGAFLSGAAIAQVTQPEGAVATTSQEEGEANETFEGAFPDMVSIPVDQADMEPAGPPVESWSLNSAQALIAFIEGVDREGLDPVDYDLQALRVSASAGPSAELDQLASKNFIWLIEDIRDGRTPMESREQWFVVDPDRELYRTEALLAEVTQSGDVEGVLSRLHPAHPDYAALRDELATTPQDDFAIRKLIRANMDRWRWLPR